MNFGYIPVDDAEPRVWSCDFGGGEDPPNVPDRSPVKTLRRLTRWLWDLPTLTVEVEPGNADQDVLRAAMRSFAVGFLKRTKI